MKKYLLILVLGLILCPIVGVSQENYYLSSACVLFEKGEYNNAQKALNVYVSVFNGNDSELARKIEKCIYFKGKAEDAIAIQQINDAIDYYRCILSINPNDPIAKKKIVDLGILIKRNNKSQTLSAKSGTSNPLRPINSGFEIRISSSFDSKGPFGLGFHFNKSYFKFGLDVILSNEFGSASELGNDDMDNLGHDVNQNIINKDFTLLNQKNNYLPDENGRLWYIQSEYIYPRAQLTVSPGINLKYFSIECGLGVFICENIAVIEYAIATAGKDQYEGSRKIKSYFTARPTIVGYIPVSSHHDCLSISLGYNFVSGAKPLNGFMFGLGLSFNVGK